MDKLIRSLAGIDSNSRERMLRLLGFTQEVLCQPCTEEGHRQCDTKHDTAVAPICRSFGILRQEGTIYDLIFRITSRVLQFNPGNARCIVVV